MRALRYPISSSAESYRPAPISQSGRTPALSNIPFWLIFGGARRAYAWAVLGSNAQIAEEPMNAFWILMAFWIGVVLGFGVFALMQVAREGSDKAEREIDALPRGVPLGVRRNRQAMGRYGELAASR